MKKLEFYLRRIHSVLVFFTLFLFFPNHIPHTAEPFFTKQWNGHPMIPIIFFGIIPFALHVLFGIYIMAMNAVKKKNEGIVNNHAKGIMYKLQIASSIIIVIFVAFHVVIMNLLRYNAQFYYVALPLYVMGILAIAYHIAYGVYTFCLTWGIICGKKTRILVKIISVIIGAAFLLYTETLFIRVFIEIKSMLGV